MNKEEYAQCIKDLEGIICDNIDQIYSDYMNVVLKWHDQYIIDLEYLLDSFITAYEAKRYIISALQHEDLSNLDWITSLDFDREYFVEEDDALRNLIMEDIATLETTILEQLEINTVDREDTPLESYIKRFSRMDLDNTKDVYEAFIKLISLAREYETNTGDTSLRECISPFYLDNDKEGHDLQSFIQEEINSDVSWRVIRNQIMDLNDFCTIAVRTVYGGFREAYKFDAFKLRNEIVCILKEKMK